MSSRLVIRKVQMEALEDAMLCRWLCDYLESCYPGRSQELGRRALWEQVRAAIGRARARGIEADQDLKKYVNVEFLLGPEFAEDPELSWARRILENPTLAQPGQRVRALEEATLRYAETRAQSAGLEDLAVAGSGFPSSRGPRKLPVMCLPLDQVRQSVQRSQDQQRPPLIARCPLFPLVDVASPVDFGERLVGSEAVALSLRLRNIGWADLAVESITLGGGDLRAFRLTPAPGGFILAPKASREISVTFTPSTYGRKSASLEVRSNAHNARTCQVLLLGAAVQPLMSLSGPIDFGVVKADGKESADDVVIASDGDATLEVSRITLEDTKHFEVRPPPLPLSIPPGDRAKVRVVLPHCGIERWTTQLTVKSNAVRNAEQSVSITGEVRGWIAFEVVDQDKGQERVAGLELVVRQQGRSEVSCHTLADGPVYIDNLRAGPCEVLAIRGDTVYEVAGLASPAGEGVGTKK